MSYRVIHNPGAFTKRQKTRLANFTKRLFKSMWKGNVVEAFNYFVSEGLNIWNDRLPALQLGKTFTCNICGYHGKFIHRSNRLAIAWNSACPNCDSRSRHRGLYILYQDVIGADQSILHFAPEPVLGQLFKGSARYKTTDYFLEDVDFKKEDIQNLSLASDSFTWALCNHVIEHVPEDDKAFSEVNRILTNDGCAIITLPGDYKRKKTVFFKDLTLNGHYRDYGLDLLDKLRIHFGEVQTVDLSRHATAKALAIRKHELAFICKKRVR